MSALAAKVDGILFHDLSTDGNAGTEALSLGHALHESGDARPSIRVQRAGDEFELNELAGEGDVRDGDRVAHKKFALAQLALQVVEGAGELFCVSFLGRLDIGFLAENRFSVYTGYRADASSSGGAEAGSRVGTEAHLAPARLRPTDLANISLSQGTANLGCPCCG